MLKTNKKKDVKKYKITKEGFFTKNRDKRINFKWKVKSSTNKRRRSRRNKS